MESIGFDGRSPRPYVFEESPKEVERKEKGSSISKDHMPKESSSIPDNHDARTFEREKPLKRERDPGDTQYVDSGDGTDQEDQEVGKLQGRKRPFESLSTIPEDLPQSTQSPPNKSRKTNVTLGSLDISERKTTPHSKNGIQSQSNNRRRSPQCAS